jgi:hypothetical protein
MLASGRGGGMEPKKSTKKLVLLRYIPSTKYFILVNKKAQKKLKKGNPPN